MIVSFEASYLFHPSLIDESIQFVPNGNLNLSNDNLTVTMIQKVISPVLREKFEFPIYFMENTFRKWYPGHMAKGKALGLIFSFKWLGLYSCVVPVCLI